MQKFNFTVLGLFLLMAFSFQSCLQDSCERRFTYTQYTPVYLTYQEVHDGQVVNEAPRELKNPGKIYFYNNYIFINEGREGVHVIDNTNPQSPQNIAFIAISGNEDVAIQNGIMYANSYVDLLAIDISDIQNAAVVGRTQSVFNPIWDDVTNGRVLVEYKEELVTETLDCETIGLLQQNPYGGYYKCLGCEIDVAFSNSADDVAFPTSSTGSSGGTGVAGSMARFSLISNHLYVVDEYTLTVLDLVNPVAPNEVNEINLGWGIETIFPYEDKLFIGSNSGMFIYDNSNPANPTYLSAFAHARACDPVVVKGNYAYVTLRDGTVCEGFNNQLDLVDITDLTNPILEKSYPMDNPHGLSIRDNTLFICEGSYGLKSFDITDPMKIDQHLLDHEKGLFAYDAIALAVPGYDNTVLVIGEDGFYQYNFDDPSDLKLISLIPVTK
ncbi:MAG: hypothetical protein KDC85_22660 [Saprospiraceae bacterium]|nr:hypothetical protein [Saprospiraceae bacterium]